MRCLWHLLLNTDFTPAILSPRFELHFTTNFPFPTCHKAHAHPTTQLIHSLSLDLIIVILFIFYLPTAHRTTHPSQPGLRGRWRGFPRTRDSPKGQMIWTGSLSRQRGTIQVEWEPFRPVALHCAFSIILTACHSAAMPRNNHLRFFKSDILRTLTPTPTTHTSGRHRCARSIYDFTFTAGIVSSLRLQLPWLLRLFCSTLY